MFSALTWFIISMLGAFLLGFAIAWAMRKSAINEWMNKYNLKADEYNTLDRKFRDSSKYANELEGNNKKLLSSNTSLKTEFSDLQSKYNRTKSDLASKSGVASELDKLRATHGDLSERYSGMEATIKDLLNANKALEDEKNALVKRSNEKQPAVKKVVEAAAPKADKAEQKTDQSEEIKKANDQELKALESKLKSLRAENDKINLDFNTLNKNFDAINESKKKVELELERSNTEIEELKGKISTNDKSSELETLRAKLSSVQLKHDENKKSYDQLQLTNGDLLKQLAVLNATGTAVNKGSDEFKEKFDNCQQEVAKLKQELETLKTKASEQPKEMAPVLSEKEAKEAEVLNRIREKAKNINYTRIGVAAETEKNDLQEIKGIGPFIETKLNALGIYTFKQIANFNEEDEEMVNDAIEFFSGRVKRDEWAKQAKELMNK